jgi:hypothetical protein
LAVAVLPGGGNGGAVLAPVTSRGSGSIASANGGARAGVDLGEWWGGELEERRAAVGSAPR